MNFNSEMDFSPNGTLGGGVVKEINIRLYFLTLSVCQSVCLSLLAEHCYMQICNNNQTDQRYEMEGLEREGLEGVGLGRKGGRA